MGAVDSIQPVEDLLTQFNDALFKTLNKYASVVSHNARHHPSISWFTSSLLACGANAIFKSSKKLLQFT